MKEKKVMKNPINNEEVSWKEEWSMVYPISSFPSFTWERTVSEALLHR